MLPAELMVDVLKGVVARGYKMTDMPNVPETWEQKGAMLISKDGVVTCLIVAVVAPEESTVHFLSNREKVEHYVFQKTHLASQLRVVFVTGPPWAIDWAEVDET